MSDTSGQGYSLFIGTSMGVVGIDPGDIHELYFIEDMFSFCMTGKVTFDDSQGLLEKAPLTGNERILLVYGGIGNKSVSSDRPEIEGVGPSVRNIVFDVVKMDKVIQSSNSETQGGNQIVFYFADTSFSKFTKYRYSRSWPDETNAKDIVNHIITKMVSGTEVIDTINMERFENSATKFTNYSMLYNTPMQAIRWLSRRSKSTDNFGYIYFNNTFWDREATDDFSDNMYSGNWVTIDSIFKTSVSDTKYSSEYPYILGSNVTDDPNSDNVFYVGKIKDWKLGGIDEAAKKMLKGGKILGYNYEGKKLLERKYKYTKKNDKDNVDIGIVDNITCLGKKTLFTNISNINTNLILGGFKSTEEMDNVLYCDFLRNYSRQMYMSIIVSGYERRFAGQLVEVKWPSKDSGEYDKNLVGLWITKSITHNFGTRSGYQQKIVLIKNAYDDSDNSSLIEATKFNIDSIESKKLNLVQP